MLWHQNGHKLIEERKKNILRKKKFIYCNFFSFNENPNEIQFEGGGHLIINVWDFYFYFWFLLKIIFFWRRRARGKIISKLRKKVGRGIFGQLLLPQMQLKHTGSAISLHTKQILFGWNFAFGCIFKTGLFWNLV